MSTQVGHGKRRRRDDSDPDFPENFGGPENHEPPKEEPEQPLAQQPEQESEQKELESEQPSLKKASISRQDNPSPSHSNSRQPQKQNGDHLKRKFQAQIRTLEQQVAQWSRRSDLTPKEAAQYRETVEFLASVEENPSQHYELPAQYVTADGAIDKKRKRELLRPQEQPEYQEKRPRDIQNSWEADQLKRAQEIIAANPDEIQLPQQQHYEFVFDDSQAVDFDEEGELSGEEGDDVPVRTNFADIQAVRRSLPAYRYRQKFLEAIASTQVLIVVGETGSGKTTQIPQYLYEEGYSKGPNGILKIGCTQPRRVAATSVARRVADEVGCAIGQEVGYSIRFEDESSPKTAIKYLTDGMLLREFLTDPLLSSYGALMIDEAHERTVSTEIVLSLLKDIIKERKDLKVIVASATINASKFADYFDGAPVFTIPGRRFPVDICYTKNPEANYIQAAITTVFQIHTKEEIPGDILVFLTGQDEIEAVEEALNDACEKLGDSIKPLVVAPIYANLPPKLQARIFEPTPPKSRKVVLATNIAETSITIDGIKYVIDPGYVKENVFNPTTGMESLVVVPCSRASADQRAGRAGRVGPGKCYRLFTKWSFYNELPANATPEILRVNLSSVVLLLLSMGISDLVHFDFMDPPSKQTLIKSLELLYALGALNAKGQLTKTGRKMAEFPMDPMFCKALLASADYDVSAEVLSIIAMLSESSSLFYRPKDKKEQADKRKEAFSHECGDHLTLLNIWKQWSDSGYSALWCEDNFLQYRTLKKARDIRDQLERLSGRIGVEVKKLKTDYDAARVQKSLFSGFFPNLARLSKMGANYVSVKRKQPVHIHPSSCLFHKKPPALMIMYHELVLTSKEYMRNCMLIDEKWIGEVAEHYYQEKDLEAFKQKNN